MPRATEAGAFVPSIPQFRRYSGTVYLFPQTVLESAGYMASMSASAAPLPFDGRPCRSGVGPSETLEVEFSDISRERLPPTHSCHSAQTSGRQRSTVIGL